MQVGDARELEKIKEYPRDRGVRIDLDNECLVGSRKPS